MAMKNVSKKVQCTCACVRLSNTDRIVLKYASGLHHSRPLSLPSYRHVFDEFFEFLVDPLTGQSSRSVAPMRGRRRSTRISFTPSLMAR